MQRLLYTTTIRLYGLTMRIASIFNPKARLWINGRIKSEKELSELDIDKAEWLWFHAASLGEFEQGRPLIESIKQNKPQYRILLTFFSPSGYEIRKNYIHADLVLYLPLDLMPKLEAFCKPFNIKAVFFVKYEFWYNLLHFLKSKQIPFYFFSVRFRPNQYFFKWYGSWFLNHLRHAQHIFVQDDVSLGLLQKAGINQCTIAGDTRFDRVAQLANEAGPLPLIEDFINSQPVFVAGSTWPSDEKLLLPILPQLPKNFKIIIAPHDVSENHVLQIVQNCSLRVTRFSSFQEKPNARVLLIDNIGMLSRIYRYATFAYIGGGFGKAIHNIQEPVAWGCPVIIGPKHHNFTEAFELIQLGGAFAVHNAEQLKETILQLANNHETRKIASDICLSYVAQNLGATRLILAKIEI